MEQSQYARLGVDAGKGSVRKVFGQLVDNDFPGAFVNIIRDPERPGEVLTGHVDGDGSKFVQRVLMLRELGDPAVFRGAADDALSMNTGDIAAAGFVSGLMIVKDVIDLNRFHVPKDVVMEQIGDRLAELKALYRQHGFKMYFLGGETADLPHQVQTGVLNVCVDARAEESDLVLGNVQSGDLIWGFASDGQAVWEDEPNSGIMSNGLTLGRMCTMSRDYTAKYPDLVRQDGTYEGRFFVNDDGKGRLIGEALISPTRQWAILIKVLLDKLKERKLIHLLHGITMNTGGGATKVLHLGKGGIIYQKQMPAPPKIFDVIQAESGEAWRNMYEDFNCGIGIDIVGDDRLEPLLSEVREETGVHLYVLGECEPWAGEGNKVALQTPFGYFDAY
ncbi:MAG: hypothetical protein WAV46_02995 [Candidatus Moraniibacteriota bacterium]